MVHTSIDREDWNIKNGLDEKRERTHVINNFFLIPSQKKGAIFSVIYFS